MDVELDRDDELSYPAFLGLYLGTLGAVCGTAWAAYHFLGWPIMRVLMALLAIQFGAGAIQRPRWMWRMLRNTGWFALLPGPLLQVLFVLITVFCIAMAIWGPELPGSAV